MEWAFSFFQICIETFGRAHGNGGWMGRGTRDDEETKGKSLGEERD